MEMQMGQLMDELRSAIQKSIAESDEIAEIVKDMARAGYDLVLVLETTLGVSKTEAPAEDIEWWKTELEAPVAVDGTGAVTFTDQDAKFLQSLHISG